MRGLIVARCGGWGRGLGGSGFGDLGSLVLAMSLGDVGGWARFAKAHVVDLSLKLKLGRDRDIAAATTAVAHARMS
ncbi:hypothetical protein TIFTF001_030487 [Ficus carica]|uniref:Uncharacterized protein n=1 Tax=Ficus carica TaxID=3494 RepID=A0AA88DU96_FICCA|nr:hypothetical protein TIFTF001_030487 [Ficus carica]